jgi:3-oxoacyl-[acyl-carrier protein] reductase
LNKKELEEAKSALIKPGLIEIEELAAAVDFFASPSARKVTGQTIYFGGVR